MQGHTPSPVRHALRKLLVFIVPAKIIENYDKHRILKNTEKRNFESEFTIDLMVESGLALQFYIENTVSKWQNFTFCA